MDLTLISSCDVLISHELSRHNNLEEQKMEEPLLSMAYDMDLPIIATNNVCYASADDFEAHDALLCIQQGKTVYDTERITSSPEYYFKSPEEMIALFEDLPEAIQNRPGQNIPDRQKGCVPSPSRSSAHGENKSEDEVALPRSPPPARDGLY